MKVKTLLVLMRCTESARGLELTWGCVPDHSCNTLIKIKCIHSNTLTTSLLLVRMVFACPWCSFLIFSHSIFKRWKGRVDPLTPKISLITPFTICHTYGVRLENFILHQLMIPKLIFLYFFILITCLLDIVLILLGEILSRSFRGSQGFREGEV